MVSAYGKQPCECGHGKSIHPARRVLIGDTPGFRSPCNHPGCKCPDYRLKKQPAPPRRKIAGPAR